MLALGKIWQWPHLKEKDTYYSLDCYINARPLTYLPTYLPTYK